MGGSSLPADLINDYLQGECRLQILRDYALAQDINKQDLVLCASFSGNTEETLSIFKEAQAKQIPTIVLANGGKLKELALSTDIPFVPIPDCIQPRCASGHFFASTLALIHRLNLLESKEAELKTLTEFLKTQQTSFEAQGKVLAKQLKERVPIVYGPTELYSIARIWKIKFNENAKIQSFFNVFPEVNHNEMVGFTNLIMKASLIYLKSQFTHPRNLKRMATMKQVLGDKLGDQLPILEVNLQGQSLLQDLFAAMAIGDYASYFLAKDYGIDPTPVEMVEEFKKLLK